MNDLSISGAVTSREHYPSFPFWLGTKYANPMSWGTSDDEPGIGAPFVNSTVTAVPMTIGGWTVSYDNTGHAGSSGQASRYWHAMALSIAQLTQQLTQQRNYATHTWSVGIPGEGGSITPVDVVWGTIVMGIINYHTSLQPEQEDILNVIESSLRGGSENTISPTNLLRACAVGASVAESLADRPHIYAALGGRIILDYGLEHGRFTAIVTDDYVHLMGVLHGEFRDRTIRADEYNLLELKSWVGMQQP